MLRVLVPGIIGFINKRVVLAYYSVQESQFQLVLLCLIKLMLFAVTPFFNQFRCDGCWVLNKYITLPDYRRNSISHSMYLYIMWKLVVELHKIHGLALVLQTYFSDAETHII